MGRCSSGVERLSLLSVPEVVFNTFAFGVVQECLLGAGGPPVGSDGYRLLVSQWEDMVIRHALEGDDGMCLCSTSDDADGCCRDRLARFEHSNGDGTVVVFLASVPLYSVEPVDCLRLLDGRPFKFGEFTREVPEAENC